MKTVDFQTKESQAGGFFKKEKVSRWVAFFVSATLFDFLFCLVLFGNSTVFNCKAELPAILTELCIGWLPLFMLTFSIVVLPVTVLIGTVEFFQSIKEEKRLTKLGEQLEFQEDMNIISKMLVFSLFVLAVQVLVHVEGYSFLPEILSIPFIVFGTNTMLPVALALLYQVVKQKESFFEISVKMFYAILFINLASVAFSRGVRLVWTSCLDFFI